MELLTPQEMAAADQRTVASGTPIATLMERAGYAVADAVAAEITFGVTILVVAGPGDNGGDAFVAARVLKQRGFKTRLVDCAGGAGGPAARAANAAFTGERLSFEEGLHARADIIIDGLFGGGLVRPLEGDFARLVAAINASAARVFAIDLPSGVDGRTGAVLGTAVNAHRSVTFCRRRVGHLLYPGRGHCGRVVVADIGIKDKTVASVGPTAFANESDLWRAERPVLKADGHKYDRGHVVAVSGPMAATGAGRLCATAALRAGAGLVTLASPPDALMVNASHLTTVMLTKLDGAAGLADILSDPRHNAVVLGPGLPPDEATATLAEAALASPAATVLDAGALTAFANDPDRLMSALAGTNTVLTPHEGEFARLFGRDGARIDRARAAAEKAGVIVVLKGADTLIAEPGGRVAINANAPPWLATAGSGDVLAGIIAAFLAQGAPPFHAAAMGTFLHGHTGEAAGPALIADDLLAALKPARAAFDTV
ncbi:MAG: NAD(P)H-hydrate dehydratase [Pseudomonadota bacterium]